MAGSGSAFGVDVSAGAIERAREVARVEGVRNVGFELGDAQVYDFAPGSFDLAISRFGTMFFDGPVAAFGNIGRALRPGGRLVMLVWQAAERNEWDVAIRGALGAGVAGDGPDAFSLGEPAVVREILGSAGFGDVTLTEVSEPVYYGPDPAAALACVGRFASTAGILNRLEPAAAAGALDRLRDLLAAHAGDDGVWFGSRSWIVTARRG
jgi:SAM-dependent methyltransferase